jgi:hypothetical protein
MRFIWRPSPPPFPLFAQNSLFGFSLEKILFFMKTVSIDEKIRYCWVIRWFNLIYLCENIFASYFDSVATNTSALGKFKTIQKHIGTKNVFIFIDLHIDSNNFLNILHWINFISTMSWPPLCIASYKHISTLVIRSFNQCFRDSNFFYC